MTDDVEMTAAGRQRDISSTIDWYGRPDATLQTLISIANIGPGVGVTLYMAWGMVSGYVAPSSDFYEAAAEWIRDQTPDEAEHHEEKKYLSDSIASLVFDPGAKAVPEAERQELVRREGFDLTTFIHLSEANAFVSGIRRPIAHEFLRIRLNDITAWTYGRVAPSERAPETGVE